MLLREASRFPLESDLFLLTPKVHAELGCYPGNSGVKISASGNLAGVGSNIDGNQITLPQWVNRYNAIAAAGRIRSKTNLPEGFQKSGPLRRCDAFPLRQNCDSIFHIPYPFRVHISEVTWLRGSTRTKRSLVQGPVSSCFR